MRVITISMETEQFFSKPMCACIGYFDGMHLGHQKLVSETVLMAKKKGCESTLITFDPDPWEVIRDMHGIRHISTLRQRMNKAGSLGINNIVILKFTKEMSSLSPKEFVDRILGRLNLKGLICGFDFHFGAKGAGDADLLKELISCDVEVVAAVTDENGKISSTRISEAVTAGNMEEAAAMLGDCYQIEGTVIHGRHQGTGIGFPTANVKYSSEYLLPKTGVYAGYAKFDQKTFAAMINVGHNPTFNYKEEISIEAHLIGCHEDLYGRHMILSFVSYMRPEIRFRTKENLIMQLEQDVRDIRKRLKEI